MVCKNCSSELSPDSAYCHVCGKSCKSEDLTYISIAEESEKKKKIIKKVIIGFASAFAAAVLCIVFMFLYALGFFSGAFGGIFGGFLGGALIFGSSDETTSEISSSADSSSVEYKSYLDKTDEYLAVNNFNEALNTVNEAIQLYGSTNELSAKRKEVLVKKGLAVLTSYETKKDYKGALTYIIYNLSEVENDAEILSKKASYIESYRSQVLTAAEGHYSSGNTEKAAAVIKDALLLLPDDSILNRKYGEYINGAVNNGTDIPVTKDEIIAFYADAVNRVEYREEAGFTMKEWQHIDNINSGNSKVDSLIMTGLKAFMTTEEDAEEITFSKGDVGIIEEFPDWYLEDNDKVREAVISVNENGNYLITISMIEEDTPTADSMLEKVTETVLIWEKIEDLLQNNSTVKAVLTDYEDVHVYYKDFTINAEITPDGKIVSLKHTADIEATIGKAEIAHIFDMENKSGHMIHVCEYNNFTY